MGNLLGKAIVEGKKFVDTVTEKVTPVIEETVKSVKEQTVNLTSQAKRTIDISVLRAEIEDLYTEFGKATFEWGLMPSNEKALEIMKVLYEKTEMLEKLEAEVAAQKEAKFDEALEDAFDDSEVGPEVVITKEQVVTETPAEKTPDVKIEKEAEKKAKTSTKKSRSKKTDVPVEEDNNKKPLDK